MQPKCISKCSYQLTIESLIAKQSPPTEENNNTQRKPLLAHLPEQSAPTEENNSIQHKPNLALSTLKGKNQNKNKEITKVPLDHTLQPCMMNYHSCAMANRLIY